MRKLFTALLCCFVLNTSISQETTLKLASDVWPPFTNVAEKGGLAQDLVNFALKRSGVNMESEIMSFDAVISGIKSDEIDGSTALWMSEDRKAYLLFSKAYLYNQLVLVAKKGEDVSAKSLADLKGKSVGIVGSYAYGGTYSDPDGVTYVRGNNDQENLEKLLNDELDYILVDALLAQHAKVHQPKAVTESLEIGTNPMLVQSLHFGVRKSHPQAQQIIAGFNREIDKMLADGSYSKILQLTWIKADMDGDGVQELVLNGNKAGKIAPSSAYAIQPNQQHDTIPTNRFYIDGKLYEGWDNVPNYYKEAPPTVQQMESVNLFNIPLKKN
ncbi:substrate-binding periplasmic protein [Roseivirga pacifica]|uniref:substrate-binding periplasmic protein n=1 Tax=Roseivirga pacifica TaxID=1267423 RepID=UPI003BAFDDCB